MDINSLFSESVDKVTNLDTSKLPNKILLEIYALYKQAKFGNCNTPKPSFWDVKGIAKWKAWNEKKHMHSDHAKKNYINLANTLPM